MALISFWTVPINEAKKAVKIPKKTKISLARYENSIIKENLISRNIPAVTIVAAWINADTGVGPSIASKSQTCKPIWADLPITPKKIKKHTKSIIDILKKNDLLKIKTFLKYGRAQYTTPKSKDWTYKTIRDSPMKNPISPNRLKIIAFNAALHADDLLFQKLINKKEQIPTPSQPTSKTPKLSAVTRTTIKKVNSEI